MLVKKRNEKNRVPRAARVSSVVFFSWVSVLSPKTFVPGKNDFAEISEILAGYRSENNSVGSKNKNINHKFNLK